MNNKRKIGSTIILVFVFVFLVIVDYKSIHNTPKHQLSVQQNKLIEVKQQVKTYSNQVDQYHTTIDALTVSENDLQDKVNQLKAESGQAQYLVTFGIKQSHVFWQVKDNIKDSIQALDLQVAVSKEYYDSVQIGQTINDDFRMASFVFDGSIGNWDITVKNKEIK